jgi:probable HAF family extracellular repeat protein
MRRLPLSLVALALFLAITGRTKADYTYTQLDVPAAQITEAYGVNNAGQVVGLYFDAGGFVHGFQYSGGGFTALNVPGSSYTQASGINDAGTIVGAYVPAPGPLDHGFVHSGVVFSVNKGNQLPTIPPPFS